MCRDVAIIACYVRMGAPRNFCKGGPGGASPKKAPHKEKKGLHGKNGTHKEKRASHMGKGPPTRPIRRNKVPPNGYIFYCFPGGGGGCGNERLLLPPFLRAFMYVRHLFECVMTSDVILYHCS